MTQNKVRVKLAGIFMRCYFLNYEKQAFYAVC